MKNINEIVNVKIDIFQIANRDHSLSWKKNSYALFEESDDIESFKEALKWCGTNGNVIRAVKKEYFDEFAKYIYKNRSKILDGSFEIDKVVLSNGTKPYSYVSKVCHIINPKMYPIIYDSVVKKQFRIKDIDEYVNRIKDWRIEVNGKSRKYIYLLDSSIWAKGIK